jgi:hypothetical protein
MHLHRLCYEVAANGHGLMKDLHIQVEWTEEEMLKAFDQHWKIGFQKVLSLTVAILGVLGIVSALVSLALKGPSVFPALLILVGLYFLIFRRLSRRHMVKVRTRRSPLYKKTIHMTFGEDGIRSRIEGLYDTTVKWDYYQRAVVNEDGILLYQNTQAFNWIPRSAFETEQDFITMLDAMQKHIMEFREHD